MKNEKNNKNKKTVIVGIILLILALLLIVIAVTVGSSKEEHVNSESIVDSTIDNTEDNVSDIVEPGVSDNDIPVAPENGEDDEVGNNGNINKDDADKFTDGDEHDKIGEEKDELNNTDDELENNNDSNNNDDESEKTDDSNDNEGSDNGENNSGENNNDDESEKTDDPNTNEGSSDTGNTEKPNDNDSNNNEPTVAPTPTQKPTPTPSPTPSEKPDNDGNNKDKVVWNGKEYEKSDAGYGEGGSMTLDTIGTKLPLLPEFNNFGVEDIGTGWLGNTGDEEGILWDVLDELRADMIDKGIAGDKSQLFGYNNYNLGFSWTFSGGQDDFELSRDPESGIYTLTICRDLKYDYTTLKNADISGYNRDIVKSLLSVMSSTPNELFDAIYDTIHGDDDMPISLNSWGSIKGVDCLGRINYDACQKGKYVFEFKAK